MTGFYSFTTIESGSIDDTTVTFSADNTVTNEAADGNVDVAISPELVIFRIQITPPGNGTTQHWIKLGLKGINTTPEPDVIIHDQNYRAIRYLSSETTAFNLDFVLVGTRNGGSAGAGFEGCNRFKVDWYEASSDGLEGGGSERPTVAFTQFRYTGLGEAMAFDKRLTN